MSSSPSVLTIERHVAQGVKQLEEMQTHFVNKQPGNREPARSDVVGVAAKRATKEGLHQNVASIDDNDSFQPVEIVEQHGAMYLDDRNTETAITIDDIPQLYTDI